MLSWHSSTQDDRAGGERHVHTPRQHDSAHESKCPIGLMYWHGGEDDAADEEEGHRDEHDDRGSEVRQAETRGAGRDQSAYGDRAELGRCEKRSLVSQDFEKIQRVEDVDAEAAPAGADAGQSEEGVAAQDAKGDQRMAHPLFDEHEGDENENADDHDAVGVGGWPPDHRALIPGKVEENQGGDAENGSKNIDTLPDIGISRLWALRRWGCGNGKNGEDGQQKASKAQDPEGPGPPESL